jgi:hypothetical protein
MTLYGFSRKDIAKSLSGFAKKNLVSGYPTEDVLQHGLGEFNQGRQTATDMELYAFISAEGIPAAVPTVDPDGSVRMQAAVSPEPCKIYKPYPRSRQGLPEDFQNVDVEVIQTGKGAAGGTNYGDAEYYVYNTFAQAIPANTISFCAVFGGVLFAIDKPPQQRVRFRLKTDFDDTGTAQAYVLDQFGNAGLAYNTEITVCDPRKLFAHAIGADSLTLIHNANTNIGNFLHAGGSVGYAVLTYEIADEAFDCEDDCPSDNICYPRWEVEQCTQIANKMKVQIQASDNSTGKITGELIEGQKRLKFTPSSAFLSHWPFVDYPPEIIVPTETGEDYKIDVYNHHMFTALDGWAIIERVPFSSRLQNAANKCVPYNSSGTEQIAEWHIVDVEKPIARWVCASFQGSGPAAGSWSYTSTYHEGYEPSSYFNDTPGQSINDHIITHECLEIDCLENNQKGVGYWDSNGQNYQIISTNSALYGKAVDIEAVAQKTDPESGNNLLAYDGCDLKYQKMSPFKVFGANPQCEATQTEEIITPSLVPVDVVSGVDRAYTCTIDGAVDPTIQNEAACNSAGGTWALSDQLCFTYNTVHVCQTTPVAEPECIDVCCDDPLGCCEYPPGTYTPNVAQADCNGTWTAGDCPEDECLPCDFCDNGGLEYQLNGIQWDSAVQSGFAGRALINTAVWTAGAGDCDATLTVEFETDEPNINNITATASVDLATASSIPACSGGLEINLSWSPATVFGVTLPTVMGQGLPSGCAGQYGLNNCGVLPFNPDTSGNWDNIADITITDCTV